MSLFENLLCPDGQALPEPIATRPVKELSPRRTAPFETEPGYYEPAGLWLYGNVRLIHRPSACVEAAFDTDCHAPSQLDAIEREAEGIVLSGQVLVCGVHNAAHQRAAIVPLRWGAPRILVFSGGFLYHLGQELKQEPFRAARLWRYQWDATCDLAISRRAPDKLPTYATYNPTVDRLVARLIGGEIKGPLFDRTI